MKTRDARPAAFGKRRPAGEDSDDRNIPRNHPYEQELQSDPEYFFRWDADTAHEFAKAERRTRGQVGPQLIGVSVGQLRRGLEALLKARANTRNPTQRQLRLFEGNDRCHY